MSWIKDIEEVGCTSMNFPIFSDTDRSVCEQFGMLMVCIATIICNRYVFHMTFSW